MSISTRQRAHFRWKSDIFFVKKCFTMTNVMLWGGKEIDLLAINPLTEEKFHIEVRVTTVRGFRLRLIDTQTKDGRKHRRGVDTLSKIKFEPQIVVNRIQEIFGSSEYKKVLVVCDVETSEVIKGARDIYGIEVWKLPDIMSEMMRARNALRIIQLISKMRA